MVHTAQDHKHFDMKMEVLASIPKSPLAVNRSVLAKDLGIDVKKVDYYIKRLRDFHGFPIVKRNVHEVAIESAGWNAARIEASKYWNTVYGA